VRSFAYSESRESYKPVEEQFWVAIQFIGGPAETQIVNICTRATCPELKVSNQILQFGEVKINDHREIVFTIENLSHSLPVPLAFPRIANFHSSPL